MKSKEREASVDTQTVEVQTTVDFKNVDFNVAAEHILEAKLAKQTRKIYTIMQKVEHGLSTATPMSIDQQIKFMS